jgi:hypothetical protein
MYQFRSKYVKAIRHVISPSISFSWMPDFSEPKYGLYGTYKNAEDNQSYKYAYSSATLRSGKQSAISFSLGNNVEAKIRDAKDTVTGFKKIKLIESLSMNGSYNLAADSLKMSTISISGSTTLMKRLTIRYSSSLDPYALALNKDPNSKELVRTNTYMYDAYGSLWRKTDEQWSTSLGYTFGPIKDVTRPVRIGNYSYWDVPWSFNVNYGLTVPREYYYNVNNQLDSVSTDIKQTVNMSGKLSLTKKWNIAFRADIDVQDKSIRSLSMDMDRDLHCWQMTFNWVPIGGRQYWNFTLRVKADLLKDLKYDMKSPNAYF